jgi:hypothetical protein
MAQLIMGHGVSGCFGTSLAPAPGILSEARTLTCGLRISDSSTSDNLTPQETKNQDAPDMGEDGAGLSCPGSSVVAEGARFENPTAPETIDLDLLLSFRSQSLTEESEIGEEPIKHDRTR